MSMSRIGFADLVTSFITKCTEKKNEKNHKRKKSICSRHKHLDLENERKTIKVRIRPTNKNGTINIYDVYETFKFIIESENLKYYIVECEMNKLWELKLSVPKPKISQIQETLLEVRQSKSRVDISVSLNSD